MPGKYITPRLVFPDQARFDLEHVQIDHFPHSTCILVFNENALINSIEKHRPPSGKAGPSSTVLRQIADFIVKA
ncbi:hypothetical protein [Gloeobacter morelensis]|uniref:Uncharacterized protein n=1 Tax=Gloeobacter morelensis MG652769 TaxID=2781736 RepID=A0ABY3PGB5_9CYAN|nr:hypothetical protein [Gloeobacter morelensis]UFP92701.1 hypothetical protein ISF26_12720 [Gloeobacter morelensis MG652769]